MKMSKIVTMTFGLIVLLILNPIVIMAQWGTCLHFTQMERDKVTVYDTPSLWPGVLEAGTVEMWFKPDTVFKADTHPPAYTYLFCKNISGNWVGDMGMHWRPNEGFMACFIQSGDASIPTQNAFSDNTVFEARWYHVAFQWDTQDSLRLFIDGVQSAVLEPNEPNEKCYGVPNGTQLINIGAGAQDKWYVNYETFPGCVDEVRISGLARYSSDFDVPEEPLDADAYTIALWHFDEGEGNIAEDISGYGFTGTLGDPDSTIGLYSPEWVKVIRDKRILINEFLADPHADVANGDANGDGVRDALQDEFIELVNVSPKAIDLTGWKIGDDDVLNFQFPDGYIIQRNEFVVIFGGGDVSGLPGYNIDQLLTKVFTASGSIGDGLDEAGDYVVMQSPNGLDNTYLAFGSTAGLDPTGTAISGLTWEFPQSTAANAANDNSITRSPDAGQEQADPFSEHLSVNTASFSPGTTLEGFATLAYTLMVNVFPAGSGTVEMDETSAQKTEFGYGELVTLTATANGLNIFDQWTGDGTSMANPMTISMKSSKVITANFIDAFQQPVSIIINEINADPSDDPILGDANGDGARHPQQDEFVELLNISAEPVDLSGWMVGDDERLSFTFPDGVIIQPGNFVTIFGGGNITGVPGFNVNPLKSRVFISDIPDTLGNGLANAGETVIVISADSSYAMYCNYGSQYGQGVPVKGFNADFYYNMRIDAATPGGYNQSMTRYPDGNIDVLDNYVLHKDVNENKESSANLTVDGQESIQVNAVGESVSELPESFHLYSNFPNPFNPTTTIRFATPKNTMVNLTVYNMLGQKVAELLNKECNAGIYEAQWNGKNSNGEIVPTGIYLYSIKADGFNKTQKMILMK